jgi:hypothetical protein
MWNYLNHLENAHPLIFVSLLFLVVALSWAVILGVGVLGDSLMESKKKYFRWFGLLLLLLFFIAIIGM